MTQLGLQSKTETKFIETNQIFLDFQNVSYVIQDGCFGDKKIILDQISGIFKPGKLNTLMGASGSGKTSLLNIITKRANPSYLSGNVFANCNPYDLDDFSNFGCFIMQHQSFAQTLTVYETLEFAAKMKLTKSQEEIEKQILKMIEQLNLEKCINTIIGGNILKGVSGGQKKRVSLGFQLIGGKDLIVLDQPTSGMDSLTAYIIVKYLKDLALNEKKNVIMTIHQPSPQISVMFDQLLFMAHGRIVYQGQYTLLLDYCQRVDFPCPQGINPVDHITEICSHQNSDFAVNFHKLCKFYNENQAQIIDKEISVYQMVPLPPQQPQVNILIKLFAMIKRQYKELLKKPTQFPCRLLTTVYAMLQNGFFYFLIGRDEIDYTNPNDATTWILISSLNVIVLWCGLEGMFFKMQIFPSQRENVLKQYNSGMYGTFHYLFVKFITDLPISMFLFLLTQIVIFCLIGYSFTASAEKYLIYAVTLTLLELASQATGICLGFLISDKKSVTIITVCFQSFQIIFSGFVRKRKYYFGWIGWIQYLSLHKYAFTSLLKNELGERAPMIVQSYGFEENLTIGNCLLVLLGYFIGISILSLIVGTIVFRNTKQ